MWPWWQLSGETHAWKPKRISTSVRRFERTLVEVPKISRLFCDLGDSFTWLLFLVRGKNSRSITWLIFSLAWKLVKVSSIYLRLWIEVSTCPARHTRNLKYWKQIITNEIIIIKKKTWVTQSHLCHQGNQEDHLRIFTVHHAVKSLMPARYVSQNDLCISYVFWTPIEKFYSVLHKTMWELFQS